MGSYRRNIVFDDDCLKILNKQPNQSEAVRFALKQTYKIEDTDIIPLSKAKNIRMVA